MDDYEAVMVAVRLRVFADDRFEVDSIVGDQCSALLLGHLEEVGVAQTPETWVVRGGRDIVAAVSKLFRPRPCR